MNADAAGPSRRRAVLGAVLVCAYAIAMESTVVSAAIPTVISGFGGLSGLSWIFSAYLISQVVTMPLFGSASDRMDRRVCYVAAAAFFALGTLACGLAWDMKSLLSARVLQGVGAGGLLTVGTAALNDLTPQHLRGRYQALGSAVWGLAAVSGPVIGSAIMTWLDWRYIFWINLPVVIVSTALMCAAYPATSRTERDGRIDYRPSIYLSLALVALMTMLVDGKTMPASGWAACIAAAGAGSCLLVRSQRRDPDPLLPVGLMRLATVRVSVVSAFLCGGIAMGATVYVPSFVAVILQAGVLAISSVVAAITLAWTASAIGVGLVIRPGRVRWLAVTSASTVLAATLVLCGLTVAPAAEGRVATLAVLIDAGVLGLGLGACSVIYSVALQSAVTDSVRGAATSLFYLMRMLGQSIGVAVCGGVLAGTDDLARTLLDTTEHSPAGRSLTQALEASAGLRGDFGLLFGMIAILALLQLINAFKTPTHTSSPASSSSPSPTPTPTPNAS